jgi:hypothetical protein
VWLASGLQDIQDGLSIGTGTTSRTDTVYGDDGTLVLHFTSAPLNKMWPMNAKVLGDEKIRDLYAEFGLCSRWVTMQEKQLWDTEDHAKGGWKQHREFDRLGALADARKRGRILAAALKVRIAQVAIWVGRVS